jgi:L-seryl-tRNA(Ser) seleniumtransferase
LKAGKRGDRYGHLTALASFLFGCEDILLVNNNAAAVFLILNTLSSKKETVVSRGELVEIGGGFRIPEVMANSGAKLVEIGTTNKTRIADYEKAISEKTSMLMKVHRSNFVIRGFSEEAEYGQIVELAKQKNLIDYYDIGSANSSSLKKDALANEADIFEIMKLSPSIVSFSADKLFGGLQAGIILGKKELIAKLKKNQLLRMLRCDKLTLAITERTMLEYAFGDYRRGNAWQRQQMPHKKSGKYHIEANRQRAFLHRTNYRICRRRQPSRRADTISRNSNKLQNKARKNRKNTQGKRRHSQNRKQQTPS